MCNFLYFHYLSIFHLIAIIYFQFDVISFQFFVQFVFIIKSHFVIIPLQFIIFDYIMDFKAEY